jgi:hypothetical protein
LVSASSVVTIKFYNTTSTSATPIYIYQQYFVNLNSVNQYGCCSFPFIGTYIEARVSATGTTYLQELKMQATRVG